VEKRSTRRRRWRRTSLSGGRLAKGSAVGRVVWTGQAKADLQAIEEYYLGVAPAYADVIVEGLLASTNRLRTFPRSGREVPEIADEALREVIYREYRVIYYINEEADRVEVLTVLHSSQQFGGLPGGSG
jgi:toxin ParE1/3/4